MVNKDKLYDDLIKYIAHTIDVNEQEMDGLEPINHERWKGLYLNEVFFRAEVQRIVSGILTLVDEATYDI